MNEIEIDTKEKTVAGFYRSRYKSIMIFNYLYRELKGEDEYFIYFDNGSFSISKEKNKITYV